MGKSKRAQADEAWLRLNTPDNTGGLPGQLDIEGQIAAADNAAAWKSSAPTQALKTGHILRRDTFCPSCNTVLPLAHGWAYSRPDDAPAVQCPRCGARYAVSEREHDEYRHMVKEYYASLPRPEIKKPSRGRRTRGAG